MAARSWATQRENIGGAIVNANETALPARADREPAHYFNTGGGGARDQCTVSRESGNREPDHEYGGARS